MARRNPTTVASDTDESEVSFLSHEGDVDDDDDFRGERAPLIEAISDSGSESDRRGARGNAKDEYDREGGDRDGTRGTDQDGGLGDQDGDETQKAKGNSFVFEAKAEERLEDEFTHATPLICIRDDDANKYEWNELVLARICLFGNSEVCLGAIVLQTKDGTESGSAHASVGRNDLTKERIIDEYVPIQQPLGYITRVTGYRAAPGNSCLLHSLRFEFASGQVIELQGKTRPYRRGDAFVVQDLPDTFLLSNIEFEHGECIGYSGYSTDIPLRILMGDEAMPDEEFLNHAHDESEHDVSGYNPTRQKPKAKARAIGDDDAWVKKALPAIEVPRPDETDAYKDKKENAWRISHICLCGGGGPAVRGCILHYYNKHRFGYLVKLDGQQASIFDEEEIKKAKGKFVVVRQPGGYIKRINGYQMLEGAPPYLCHSLELEFASGQIVSVHGVADAWKGKYFSYDPPEDFYITKLKFSGRGHVSSVVGVRTKEMNFPPMQAPKIQGKKTCCPCCPC